MKTKHYVAWYPYNHPMGTELSQMAFQFMSSDALSTTQPLKVCDHETKEQMIGFLFENIEDFKSFILITPIKPTIIGKTYEKEVSEEDDREFTLIYQKRGWTSSHGWKI